VFDPVSVVVLCFSCSVLRSMMYAMLVYFISLYVSPSKINVSTIIVSQVALFRCGGASLADIAKHGCNKLQTRLWCENCHDISSFHIHVPQQIATGRTLKPKIGRER
jgi:hypothetical protein